MTIISRINSEITYLCSVEDDDIRARDTVDSFGIYNWFSEIWKQIDDQYSSSSNCRIVRNEYAFLRKLSYLGNTSEDSFTMKDYLKLIDEKEQLHISQSSLNLLLNRYFFTKQYRDLREQYEKMQQDSTWDFRRLLSAHCLRMRYRIGKAGQFTYNGERFVIVDTANLEHEETDNLLAVHFRRADTFSSINSLRLIEKVFNYIRKIEKDDSPSTVIKIAAFGRFSDQKNGNLWLEQLSNQGYFTDEKKRQYRVQVTSFKLTQLTEFRVMFDECIDDENKLNGNLLDPDFLYSVCKKYEVVCLMDMGCFYMDTNRFEDTNGDSPYEAVRSRSRSIEHVYERKGVGEVGLSAYDGLYNAYIKWIENYFYGKKHSYEFDARLFSALMELNEKLEADRRSTSVYSFMSKNRGSAISSDFKYRNLCKGEYYEGRPLIAYDWSPAEKLNSESIKKRNSDVFADEYSSKSLFPIRLWKIIKSLGDYFFSKRFIGLIKDEKQEIDSSEPDLDFVKYAKESFVVIDYSMIKENRLSLAIKYFPTDIVDRSAEEDKACQYFEIAKRLVISAAKLAFAPDCYEACASGYCRNVIVNAMITDGVGAEHILLAKRLELKPFLSEEIEIDSVADDVDLLQERPKKESPALYSQHQVDNLAISEAISRINRSSLGRFDRVVELLEEMIPSINASDGTEGSGALRLDCAELLHHIKSMCEKIGYTDCQLYRSIR